MSSIKKQSSTASMARTAVAWRPKKELARHEWLVTGRRLGGISRCNQWWLGDWVRYGNEKWGEKYTHAAKITGYDPRSLANMASVSAAFHSSRRRDDLTWSHHVAVAALPEEEQEQWLDRAGEENLSVADLRTELRATMKDRRRVMVDDEQADGPAGNGVCPWCGRELPEELRAGSPTSSNLRAVAAS